MILRTSRGAHRRPRGQGGRKLRTTGNLRGEPGRHRKAPTKSRDTTETADQTMAE